MALFNRRVLFLFLLCALQSAVLLELNRQALRADGITLRADVAVITADDASYLQPAINHKETGVWKSNAVGTAAYFTRSPGYGGLYRLFLGFLDAEAAVWFLICFQVLLWAMAVACIPELAVGLGISARRGFLLALLVALMPTFSGFLGYTLTEGMSPALLIAYLLFVVLALRSGLWIYLWAACVLMAFILLLRPALLPFAFALLPVFISFWRKHDKPQAQRLRRVQVLLLLILIWLPLSIWQFRSYRISGSWQGIHPIYQWDSNDLYRPIHGAIWDFHKLWGQRGYGFHTRMLWLWDMAQEDRSPEELRENLPDFMATFPERVRSSVDSLQLQEAYVDYYRILLGQQGAVRQNIPMPSEPSGDELELMQRFESLQWEYLRRQWWHAGVWLPVRVYFVDMAAHSNLNMYLFQKSCRGHWFCEFLRHSSFLLHLGIFVLFLPCAALQILRAYRGKGVELFWMLSLPLLSYLGYLAVVQRGVEERYTLPVLIPMLLLIVACAKFLPFGKIERNGR